MSRSVWPTTAGRLLVRAARYAKYAVKTRDPKLLAIAWGYLRLARDAVERMPEPET